MAKNSKKTSKPPEAPSPEFDLSNPLASFLAVIRAVVLSPKRFFANFETDGPMREPAVFALLVGILGAVLSLITAPILAFLFGSEANISQGVSFGLSPLGAVLFAVVSPLLVAALAGTYFISIRMFIGGEGDYRRVFRMAAYAYSAMFLAPIPVIGAFAVTYSLMIMMGLGVYAIYRSSFMTTLVTALTGFVPVAVILIPILAFAA